MAKNEVKNIEDVDLPLAILTTRNDKLQSIASKLDKSSDDAIQLLESIINDNRLPAKERADAAKYLLSIKVKLHESMADDLLRRQIAVAMMKKNNGNNMDGVSKDADRPIVDFSKVREA